MSTFLQCRGVTSLTFVLSLVLFNSNANAEVPAQNEDELEISVASTIEAFRGFQFQARCDLGRIPVSRQVKVEIVIQNPFDRRFEFDQISSGCKCAQVKASKASIEERGEFTVDLILNSPANVKEVQQTVSISFKQHGTADDALYVVLTYELEGLLSFNEEMVLTKGHAENDSVVWKIPFLMTDPCQLSRVEVKGHGVFADKLKTRVSEEEGKYFIHCQLPTKELASKSLAGEIEIIETDLKRSDTILNVVELAPEMELAPFQTRLRFDEENEVYEGSFLIRFRKGILVELQTLAEGAPISVVSAFAEEQVPDMKLKSRATRLAEDVYRVHLTAIPHNKGIDQVGKLSPFAIEHNVSAGAKRWKTTAKVVFSKL